MKLSVAPASLFTIMLLRGYTFLFEHTFSTDNLFLLEIPGPIGTGAPRKTQTWREDANPTHRSIQHHQIPPIIYTQ